MRISLSALRTLQRIRAATTDDARWLAWRAAHAHVRAPMIANDLVHELDGRVFVGVPGQLVLAGADAQRRTYTARRTASWVP